MNNTLTIIIPVYKLEEGDRIKYFSDLVESILLNFNKGFENSRLKEIVVVNDYIDQETIKIVNNILDKHKLKDKLVFIQNEINQGQAMSRNIGAKKATGDYLHFIDQDDFISEDFYSLLLNNGSEELIFGHPNIFYNNEKVIDGLKSTAVFLFEKLNLLRQIRFLLIVNIAYSPGQYLISKNTFIENDGFPDLINKGCDDYGILYKLASIDSIRFSYSKKALFYYRQHNDQNRKSLNMQKSLQEFFESNTNSAFSFRMIRYLKTSKFSFFSKLIFYFFFNK